MQLKYGNMERGLDGQVSTDNPVDGVSLTAETDIKFALAVQRGAKDSTMKIIATGGAVLGFTVLNLARPIRPYTDGVLVNANSVGSVLRAGYFYKKIAVAVKAGDKVYAVPGTGELTNVNTGNIACGSSTFEKDAAVDQITLIRAIL